MLYRYRVQTFKYLISVATVVTALLAAALMFYLAEWLGVILFLVIAVIFSWLGILYGAVIIVEKDKIRKTFWGMTIRSISWDAIQEVGVIGTRIFKSKDSKRQGERYIYLSPRKLDENGRFQLAMKWPPGKMIYFYYTKERIDEIQMFWNNTVEAYNAGDVFF